MKIDEDRQTGFTKSVGLLVPLFYFVLFRKSFHNEIYNDI